eukprot:jgi/Botrbrau1/20450/Bobra.145_2s0014.1
MSETKKKAAKAKVTEPVDSPVVDGERTKTPGKKKKKADSADKVIKDFYAVYSDRPPRKGVKLDFTQKQQVKYIREATYNNVWYYRDRLSVPRGPCTLPVLRECWVQGIIDESTLIWGQGLIDFIPIRNVRTLIPQIRTLEVQLATFLKKHLSLKPALARMRKLRGEERPVLSDQVDRMY